MAFQSTLTDQGWSTQITAEPSPAVLQAVADAIATMLSSTPPVAEAVTAAAGAALKAARGDHAHQRLSSSHGDQTLAADGTLTITYSRTFDKAPSVTPVAETPAAGTLPPTLTYKHVTSGGLWTGVTVTGTRPGPVTVGILGVAVVATTVPAAGAKFSLLAVQASTAT